MFNGIAFSSVFKIEEKPILRPCLSESKREEIQRFRAKALEIERRLAEKHKNIIDCVHHTSIQEERTDFHRNNQKFADDIESCSGQSENHTDVDIENFVTSISEWDISSIPGFDQDNGAASLCSAANETIEYSENVNATAGQSNENTFVPATLIRSDSFIVDEPSECFLKQLEYSGVVFPSVSNTSLTDASNRTELNQTKIFVKPVEKRKPEVKKNVNPKLKKYPPKPFPFKKGRISSDNISNLPEKLIRKCQNNTVNVVDIRKDRQQKVVSKQTTPIASNSNQSHHKTTSSMDSSFTQTDIDHDCYNDNSSAVDKRIADIVASIEAKFHDEIVMFLEKQKREQDAFLRKLMSQVKLKQDAFQCNLVMQIKSLIGDDVSALLKNHDNNLSVLNNTSNLMNDVNGNLSLLEVEDNDCHQTEIITAATKINAFVRGYLTRRMFKTEHVQEIIKTIRDSLYLVIDLHFERNDVESVADIQMKHNLLQQLESNRYNLSYIFVTQTTADRMAMIAYDRQTMMHRLVQSNSKNRSNGPTSNVNRPRSMNVEDKLKKLEIIELFSDSISGDDARPCQDE